MRSRPDHPYRGKRILDLAVLAVVAVPASVVGVLCALAVKLTSRGPVFFRQERVGMGERSFAVWKFRTMVDADNPIFPALLSFPWVMRRWLGLVGRVGVGSGLLGRGVRGR